MQPAFIVSLGSDNIILDRPISSNSFVLAEIYNYKGAFVSFTARVLGNILEPTGTLWKTNIEPHPECLVIPIAPRCSMRDFTSLYTAGYLNRFICEIMKEYGVSDFKLPEKT